MSPLHPVIVGVGQITCRPQEHETAPHALQLVQSAAEACVEDSRCPTILSHTDSVTVVNMFSWEYNDPAGQFCEMLRITPKVKEYTAIGGNTPQWLVNRAADKISRGEINVALLAGAEAMSAVSKDTKRNWLTPPGDDESLPPMIGDTRWGSTPHEMMHNASYPIHIYPLYENALRARRGHSIDDHQAFLGEYCARFSKIAARNPFAWFREERSGAEISTITEANRMVNFPYTKFMNPIMHLNQAAALIITSADTARALSIPKERWVYLHGGADAHDRWFVSERNDFVSSPVVREVATASLAMADTDIGQINFFDLYSCFPSATMVQAMEIGLDIDNLPPLTITGGLPYFGGPGNNYTMHAIARAVEKIRQDPDATGFISALGWYFTKYSVGIYSGREPHTPWNRQGHERIQIALDGLQGPVLNENPKGPAYVETYTVMHDQRGEPAYSIIIARTENGERCWAQTERDADLFHTMETEEFIGRKGYVRPGGDGPNIMTF